MLDSFARSPSRRDFLQAGLCAAAVAAAPAVALTRGTKALTLYKIIFDERFAASRQFGEAAGRQGVAATAIRGKVNELWRDDLYHQWQDKPQAIAGMTTAAALFLLAMMGEDAGMRVLYRAHHVASEGGAHPVFGPVAILARQPALAGASEQWARTAANIVTSWPRVGNTRTPPGSTVMDAGRHLLAPDTLITWIMAPKAPRV
jgi:hypothetical protein